MTGTIHDRAVHEQRNPERDRGACDDVPCSGGGLPPKLGA